jgi:peptide deformylase
MDNIRIYPDPVLRKRAQFFGDIDGIVNIGEGLGFWSNLKLSEEKGNPLRRKDGLSLPTMEVPVKRMGKVFVRGRILGGNEVSLKLFGFPGRGYQHEIDH